MDKNSMAKATQQLETKEDLLRLLNQIKQDEMTEYGMSDKFYPFMMKHLNYYCNPNNSFHRYKQFKIKKKSSGFRLITAPRNKSFMLLLRLLNNREKTHKKRNIIALVGRNRHFGNLAPPL